MPACLQRKHCLALALVALGALALPAAAAPLPHLSRFGEGDGPRSRGATIHLLDERRTPSQSNAVAFDRQQPGAHESVVLRCRMSVEAGGDGAAFAFLSTARHGVRGPAPFVSSWAEPNLPGSFAVGIDVHEPKSEEPFGPWGNYQGKPERLVSLHWDGREIVKRVAGSEFRGATVPVEIAIEHVAGGADVTVRLGAEAVYERFFIAGMTPYEMRLAIGAGTRADATTLFDVSDVTLECLRPATPLRQPVHVEVFNHVLTDSQRQAFDKEVVLPPAEWAFARVIMTIEIHDAGDAWDEWDRNGEVSVWDDGGTKHGIVPFITSYRTQCRWQVDVTHFRPWLAGPTRLEIAAGTTFYKNRGFMMSLSLDYWRGTPALEPARVTSLWEGTAQHGSEDNHFRDFFEPRRVTLGSDVLASRIVTTTTGHSQVGEFTPSRRTIVVAPDASAPQAVRRHANVLWKDDCWLNPNRPQFGTWKYSRAGWAPGDVVRPWWIDLGDALKPGATALFSYEPEPYDFSEIPEGEARPSAADVAAASHVVRSYLVEYRAPTASIAPPSLLIANVVADGNAAKAGLKEGDWLVSYDGRSLVTADDLRTAVGELQAAGKESAEVVAYRGAERLTFTLPPGRLGVNIAER